MTTATKALPTTTIASQDHFGLNNDATRIFSIPGKCGELLQGVHPELGPFFVSGAVSSSPYASSLMVDRRLKLSVECDTSRPLTKTVQAIEAFAIRKGIEVDELCGALTLRRRTPVGKGLGSSSIDAALAIFAIAWANDLTAHPREVYSALCDVERSDPAWMWGELVCAQPEAGRIEVLGKQPQFLLLAWDTALQATVDTTAAASLDKSRVRHARQYADLLEMVRTGDPIAIQQAATASSILNNQFLPKPEFASALAIAQQLKAGLLSAHSGTYLGLLLAPDTNLNDIAKVRTEISQLGFRPEIFLMGGK